MSDVAVRSSRPAPAPALDAPRPPLELVDPHEWRRRRRTRALAMLVGLAVLITPFAVVAMNVMMAQQQFRLEHLRTQLDAAQRHNQELSEAVSSKSSGASIVPRAEAAGLVRAPGRIMLQVRGFTTSPSAAADRAAQQLQQSYQKSKPSLGTTAP